MTTSLDATVTAEIVTRYARVPWQAQVTLDGEAARVYEVTVPDGTLALPLLAFTDVTGLWIATDAPVQITLGTRASNTPLTLAPYGLVALMGYQEPGPEVAAVTYAPGTGVAAHLVVYVLGGAMTVLPPDPEPPTPGWVFVTFHEPWEVIQTYTTSPYIREQWES